MDSMSFFDDNADDESYPVPRDDTGRPLIVPPGGGDPVHYERASSIPGLVDNQAWLMRWKLQITALGLAHHPEYLERVADLSYGDPELLRTLDELQHHVDDSAQWGTDVHLFTEPTTDRTDAPPEMVPDLAAYDAALTEAGITILDTEVFVVNDELRVAGTLDHLADVPGYGVCVIDKKTGQFHPRACAVQAAIYANGVRYDPATAERWRLRALRPVNREWAMIARIPRGGGSCTIKPVRIDRGYELAKRAMNLLDYQAGTVDAWCGPDVIKVTRSETLHLLIARADSRDALLALYRVTPRACWTAAHTDAAKARVAKLATEVNA